MWRCNEGQTLGDLPPVMSPVCCEQPGPCTLALITLHRPPASRLYTSSMAIRVWIKPTAFNRQAQAQQHPVQVQIGLAQYSQALRSTGDVGFFHASAQVEGGVK